MSSLKDIKRRILSIKNTQKITNAMKLVSASKFSKFVQYKNNSKSYLEKIDDVIKSTLINRTNINISSKFLKNKENKKYLFILKSTDRGLCGSLNVNLFKNSNNWLEKNKLRDIDILPLGHKANEYFNFTLKKQKYNLIKIDDLQDLDDVLKKNDFDVFKSKILNFIKVFDSYDKIFVMYSRFHSSMIQKPFVFKYLPIDLNEFTNLSSNKNHIEFEALLEIDINNLLNNLIEDYLIAKFYFVVLDSSVSEHCSRMNAMDSATNNAREIIKNLTLEYNRARQAIITKELIEITSGAESLI